MWHEDPYKQCPTQIEYIQPKFKVLGHLSNHFCYLISNTGLGIMAQRVKRETLEKKDNQEMLDRKVNQD